MISKQLGMTSKEPSACDDPRLSGFPCYGSHKEGALRQNQYATWTMCTRCGLRLRYATKKEGRGHTRQMGPDPSIIRLALETLQKTTSAAEMNADTVNGKMMEIKGTMLQMGFKTYLSLNLTLAEYEKRPAERME